MKYTRVPLRQLLPAASTTLLLLASHARADTIAYWNFNGLSIAVPSTPGSGDVPTSIAADFGTATLSLSGWLGTVDDFGGTTINAQGADPSEESLSLVAGGSAAPFPGNGSSIDLLLNLTGFENPIISFAGRGTGTGFNTGSWSYSTGGAFTPITGNTATTSTTFALQTLDLSAVDALDGAANVTLRYTLSGATSSSGNNRIDNLLITATTSGTDVTAPTIASRIPADNATDLLLPAVTQLDINFTEAVLAGSGSITIKKSSDDSTIATFDVANQNDVAIVDNVVTIFLSEGLFLAGTSYYVEMPAGAFEDLAGNDFAGLSGSSAWDFAFAAPPAPPTVVVNKYLVTDPDTVELLVVGDGTPATTVDMRGMIVKDFSGNMASDGGGKFEFSTDVLWSAVPVGTLVVLTEGTATSDVDPLDFVLKVGLSDTTYFTGLGGTFDISQIDLVMIKAAGSGAAGTSGGIHGLAGGVEGSFFTSFAGNKLRAGLGSSAVVADNATGTLADFSSGTATGGVLLATSDFGLPNNGANGGYIASLRGLNPSSGDGTVVVLNGTPGSPYANAEIFDDGQSSQTAKVVIKAFVPTVTLTDVTVEVPAALGTPTLGTVSLSGPGAAGATFGVAGQTITVNSASATTTNALEVNISGLTTPTPTLPTETGNHVFHTSTAGSGGTLTPVTKQAAAHVVLPISFIHDLDENGVLLDAGTVVAVEGVVTEEDFGSGSANFSGYIQDSTQGVNVFSSSVNPNFIRGNRFAIAGTVTQFQGLAEVVVGSAANVVNLGAATEPAPAQVSLATLLADPESYEGELITVQNLFHVSGTWGASSTVVLQSGGTDIAIRIQAGSTATTEPAYPVTVTGVFGQFDGSNPFTTGYQLMPRDAADLTAGTLTGFDAWAAANGISGQPATGDFDKDGLTNLMEYALGLSPTAANGAPGTLSGGVLTFTKGAEAIANGDVDWVIEDSTTLGAEPDPWTEVVAVEEGNNISYALPVGQGKIFARLTVTQITPP